VLHLPEPEGTLTRLARDVFTVDESRESSWDTALLPGAVVGRFELIRQVGKGGFGTVWEARDTKLKRTVAFKAIRGHVRSVSDERALAEAEAAAHLTHPNVVTLHDIGHCEHGTYLVMEFLTGRSLREVVRDGPLSPEVATRIGAQVARGLAHAHGKGVLHRDLTASNVFACDGGTVKLLDLGLARDLGGEGSPADDLGGTPGYVPPERLRGEPEDARSDLYGLGALLHLMLTGKKPEAGVDAGARPGPPALNDLVARLLADDPARRPASALEVERELERVLVGQAATGGLAASPARRKRRGAFVGAALAAAALVLGALAIAVVVRRGSSPPPPGGLSVHVADPVIAVGQATRASAATVQDGGDGSAIPSPSWATSDPHVATVDSSGTVTARGQGTATITAFTGELEGSDSVVVTGPEWQLVSVSSLAPPPAGSSSHSPGGADAQGVARVWGRSAWFQRGRASSGLLVPIALPEGTDQFALQVDVRFPDDSDRKPDVGVSIASEEGMMSAKDLLDIPTAGRWRTLRIEGSFSRCRTRVLLDGVAVSAGELRCDARWQTTSKFSATLHAHPDEGGSVGVAWSNLSVFRATPVDRVEIVLHRLPPGGDRVAKANAALTDTLGNPLLGRTVEWSSSNPDVAQVDSTGAIIARDPGEATIIARCEGKTASERIRIPATGEPRR